MQTHDISCDELCTLVEYLETNANIPVQVRTALHALLRAQDRHLVSYLTQQDRAALEARIPVAIAAWGTVSPSGAMIQAGDHTVALPLAWLAIGLRGIRKNQPLQLRRILHGTISQADIDWMVQYALFGQKIY